VYVSSQLRQPRWDQGCPRSGSLSALTGTRSSAAFYADSLDTFLPAFDGEAELGRELFAEFRDHYPIVLTRARHGMVIFVPPGAKRDRTRRPAFYEGVYEYLTNLGVPQV
jgi:predicted GNAT superfamily acetyltransferase